MRSTIDRDWRDNLYFGLKPPTGKAEIIANSSDLLSNMLEPGYKQTIPQCLHVSLVSCNKHACPPESLIAQIHDRMNGFKGSSIDIVFDRLGAFGRNSIVLYKGGTDYAFDALRRSILVRTMVLPDIRRANRNSASPHMTIFHGKLLGSARRVETLAWRAQEVLLIYSHNGASWHTVVGRWPLTANKFEADATRSSAKHDWDLFY